MKKALGLIETRGLTAAIAAADRALKTAIVNLEGKEITEPGYVTIIFTGELTDIDNAVAAGSDAARKTGELISSAVIGEPDNQLLKLIPGVKTFYIPEKDKALPVKKAGSELKPEKALQQSSFKSEVKKPADAVTKKKVTADPGPANKRAVTENITSQKAFRVENKQTPVKEKKPVKKEQKQEETKLHYAGTLFESATDTISRLRREALGKSSPVPEEKTPETPEPVDLDKLNVHLLRKLARSTPGFPIAGRQISKAGRGELISIFNSLKT